MRDMTRDRFEELLALHGAELSEWPQEEQTTARAALATDPSLQALLDEETRLGRMLARADEVPPSWGLSERIIAATRAPSRAAQSQPSIFAWLEKMFSELMFPRPAYALSVAILLGFLIGLSTQAPAVDTDPAKEFQMVREFLYGGAIL